MNYHIRKLIAKGDDHKVWCQDFMSVHENNNFLIAGVFDGCSSGINTQFAANVCGKIFNEAITFMQEKVFDIKKNSAVAYDREGLEVIFDRTDAFTAVEHREINIDDFVEIFCYRFMLRLRATKEFYELKNQELWTTCVFHFHDKNKNKSLVIFFGDGCVNINGVLTHINNENNLVHYPIDYPDELFTDILSDSVSPEFSKFIKNYDNKIYIDEPKDVSICTDGIATFFNKKSFERDSNNYCKNYLLNGLTNFGRKENMLNNNHYKLTEEGWVNKDDLAIIRIVFEQ